MTSSLPNFEQVLKLALESAKEYADLQVSKGKENPFTSSRDLSYSEFREMMTHAMRSGVSSRSKIQLKSQSPHLSAEEIMVIELLMTMMCCINALCCNHVQRLVDIIKASATEEGRKKYGTARPYAKSGTIRSIINRLQKVNNEHMKSIEFLCDLDRNNGKEFVARIADAMDAAEECLDEPMKAYVRYFYMKATKKTLSTPEDPEIMMQLMICVILTDINYNIYEHITGPNNFPFLKKVEKYKVFSCNDLHEQVVRLTSHIDLRDTNGKESKFNASGVMNSKESMEIFSDILTILYSTEFLDKIALARDGRDTLMREECKSILPSYESKTKPIEFYRDKYKSMYI